MRQNVVESIKLNKIISIVRDVPEESLVPVIQALYEGGIRLIEITFDASGKTQDNITAGYISMVCKLGLKDLVVGAGTVLNENQVVLSQKAGAEFILSPNVDNAVIRKANELNMVSLPGALTPTEIVEAYQCGANFVQLFPAAIMGVDYIKDITAPLRHIPIVAVGGIGLDNIQDFINAGAVAVGVGSTILSKSFVVNKDYKGICRLSHSFIQALEI